MTIIELAKQVGDLARSLLNATGTALANGSAFSSHAFSSNSSALTTARPSCSPFMITAQDEAVIFHTSHN